MTVTRHLRPMHIVRADTGIWVVDRFQPVALLLASSRDEAGRVVDWRDVPDLHQTDGLYDGRAFADGDDLVIQPWWDGPIVWVSPDGSVASRRAPGWRLDSAGRGSAWLTRQDVGADQPSSQSGPGAGSVAALTRGGELHRVRIDAPVSRVLGTADGLVVTSSERSIVLPWLGDALWLDDGEVDITVAVEVATPPTGDGVRRWFERDTPASVRARGFPALGLLWTCYDDGSRELMLTGHDPASAAEVARADLGPAAVLGAQQVDDELWLAVDGLDGGDSYVTAVDRAGIARPVTVTRGVDITAHCVVPVRPDETVLAEHLRTELSRFEHLDRPGLQTAVVGEWPVAQLQVTFELASRPGLTIRRRLALFDEYGAPTDNEYADTHLVEDMVSGAVPTQPVGATGVIDI